MLSESSPPSEGERQTTLDAAAPNPGPSRSAPRAKAERRGPITLREALALAREANPDVRAAMARLSAARAMREEAFAALRPRLSADFTLMHTDAPSSVLFKTIDAHALGPGADFNAPSAIDVTEAGLSAAWNLWNGGRDGIRIETATLAARARGEALAAVRNALSMAVIGAWLDARAADELGRADEASVRSIESQLAEVRSRVEQGAALRSDQLSLEVRLAEARERRLRTDLGRRLALASLANLLALEGDEPLEMAPGAPGAGDVPGPAGASQREALDVLPAGSLPATLSEAKAAALVARPEARAALADEDRARLEVLLARRAHLPRLDLAWRWYGTDLDYGFDLGEPNSIAALSLTWDLFEGGARRAALDAAIARATESRAESARAASRIALEVETAWLRREEARARVDVATQALAAGRESLQLVEKQFRAGSATVTRYLESEAAQSAAESSLIRARIDLERSGAELARALGALCGDEP